MPMKGEEYVGVIEPMYLRLSPERILIKEPPALRFALVALAFGTFMTGILPQFWVELAGNASTIGGQ